MKRFRAAVLGGSGFAGAELIRHLIVHPEVELVRVGSADHLGEPLSRALPHLEGRTELRFEAVSAEAAAEGVDIILMGLPWNASVDVVEAALVRRVKVLDLSGAFRLRRAEDYLTYYGSPHPRPDLLSRFIYGLPELNREAIRSSDWVASPGCFATALELSLLPFARAGWLRGPVHAVGVTGSSGSGAVPSAGTHHPVRANNLRSYKPHQHPHSPEVESLLRAAGGSDFTLSFVPVSAPLVRGILGIAFFQISNRPEAELRACLEHAYRGEPFVRIPEARLPEVVAVSGSNYAEVGLAVGKSSDGNLEVTAFAALDNLVKGGAGQAIQNMNLMLGLDETLTLTDPGSYP